MNKITKTELIQRIIKLEPSYLEIIGKLYSYYTKNDLINLYKRIKKRRNYE